MRKLKIILNFILLSSLIIDVARAAEKPHDELIVVQTVSKNKRSFVVSKGIKDGLERGQEIIFSNENISILCKAQEVNRNYSLWIPVDKNINIPFNKEEIITYSSHAYGNISLNLAGNINQLLPADDSKTKK